MDRQSEIPDWLLATGVVTLVTVGGIILYKQLKKQTGVMKISTRALNFLIREEIGSAATYAKKFTRPVWPGGGSGITIGIGYDLGYHSPAQISRDWKMLPAAQLKLLVACAGKIGADAQNWLAANQPLQFVYISYELAAQVFSQTSLPRAATDALKIYPGLDKLLPDAVGGLVSMIYNRGTSLEGSRRTEIKAIVPLVASKDYNGIAELIERSKRLWVGAGLDGLLRRRDGEAALVRGSVRQYSSAETFVLPVAA